MSIFINGFYKHGNHALMKACELLGLPQDIYPNHIPFDEGLPKDVTHHLFIKRDPRNAIISALRFQNKDVTSGTFISYFREFSYEGKKGSYIENIAPFEPWLTDPKTFVIPFEDLVATDGGMRAIAEYLGVPYLGGFDALPGLTKTWTGNLSNFADIWSPEVEKIWDAEGGNELLKRWGY